MSLLSRLAHAPLRAGLAAVVALAALALCACSSDDDAPLGPVTRIAFGSCMHEDRPKPVLDRATDSAPDLFVFLGDNLYGDTDDMAVLEAKYAQQAAWPELQRLRAAMPTLAIWDDHDYGRNDAGAEYPFKLESKDLFLDFWQEPADSARRSRDGLYTSQLLELDGGTVHIILLDLRWFRDPLDPNTGAGMNDYQPTADTTRSMLGAEQWAWLEAELTVPADVRLIGSSIQFAHQYNGWESWTNMPHERQHLVDVVRASGAEATLILSGDAHWAELSRHESADGYPLYDLTSSGITEQWPTIPPNANRIGDAVPDNNYGFVDIAWTEGVITLGIVDVHGTERIHHDIPLRELR
jgi:alkaline phosphatase D